MSSTHDDQPRCPFPGIDHSKLEKIPIPPMKYFGLLGHLPEIDRDFPVSSLWKLMDTHGPILEADLQGRRILVGNHELFKEMLDGEIWVKQPSKAQLQLRNVGGGDGLVTAFSGEKNWGIARRLLNPSFGPLGLRNMFDDMLEISSQLVLMWDRYGPDNEVECVDAFTRLTFDTIGLCAFNVRFNEFYMQEVHPFVKHLSEGLIECGRRANRPEFLNTLLFYRAEKERQANMKRMRDLSEQIVRDWETKPKPGATSTDFLNVLLHGVDKETGEKVPGENVRYQIATFLAAGYDTTASSLAFLYYYLCDSPNCLRKAQQEVDEVVGDKVVTVNMLPKLVYLKACIQESLRLNSPVNILNRDATKDTVLGGKYLINKGVSVSCLLRHLHRDPEVWGDDADEFRPERMLDGGFEALPASAWMPFGNGPRVCIGRGFAEQEMLISLSQVLQRFYIQKADPSYKLVLRSTLTTKPAGFKMKVRRRPNKSILVGIPGGAEADSHQNQKPRQSAGDPHEMGKGKPVCVFFGGNMGTSEGLAHDLAERAPEFGLEVEIRDLDAAVESLPIDRPCIIIAASYEGKPPDNARKFVAWLERLARESGQLPPNIRYAVFGVGNSDWAGTFHKIPKLIDETMFKLGADQITEAQYSNVKLDILGPWEEWRDRLCVALSDNTTKDQIPVGLEVSIEKATSGRRLQTQNSDDMISGTIVSNRELADKSVGAAKRHVDVRLAPGCTFAPGDYLVIQGRNSEEAVRRVLTRFKFGWYDVMTIKSSKKIFIPTQPTRIGAFLSTSVELATPVTRRQLSILIQWAEKSSKEQAELQNLHRDDVYETLLERRYSIIDILDDIPGLCLPFGVYIDLLLPLTPRQYSISSAPQDAQTINDAHGPLASVTFDVFDAPALSGHGTFRGVVSNHLSACRSGDRILCVVRQNTIGFCLPPDPKTPMIMLAAGTGIAPIRAFIEQRAAIKAGGQTLGPAILFFGCRNPEKDYIYRSDLDDCEKQGVVEVDPCFSKPGGGLKGRYVADGLWEQRDRVWNMLQKGAKIFVCGSAARLGRSSANMIKQIYIDKTGKTEVEADDWLEEMKNSGVYVRDVY